LLVRRNGGWGGVDAERGGRRCTDALAYGVNQLDAALARVVKAEPSPKATPTAGVDPGAQSSSALNVYLEKDSEEVRSKILRFFSDEAEKKWLLWSSFKRGMGSKA
jgi:hypothetical protein